MPQRVERDSSSDGNGRRVHELLYAWSGEGGTDEYAACFVDDQLAGAMTDPVLDANGRLGS